MFKYVKSAVLALAAGLMSVACVQEEQGGAAAVMTDYTRYTFEAIGAEPMVIPVYADGEWMADVSADWLMLDPMSGNGSVDVVFTVEDNVENGAMAAPRTATVTLRGRSDASQRVITIVQKGDTYLGAPEIDIEGIGDLDPDQVAKINSCVVVAVANDGFVVKNNSYVYVVGKKNVKVGDNVTFSGKRIDAYGFPSFEVDELTVGATTEVTHPTAQNVDGALGALNLDQVPVGMAVSVSGTLVGDQLRNLVGNQSKEVYVLASALSEEVAIHKVVATGYYIGKDGDKLYMVATSFKDNGVDESIGVDFPFRDDFSWLDPYIAAVRATGKQVSSCVEEVEVSADGAINIYSNAVLAGALLPDLRSRYTDLNPEAQTIYLQDAYLKFGKTDVQSGLILPLMKIQGTRDVAVTFKWCCHLSGALNVDNVKLQVSITGPGTVQTKAGTPNAKASDPIASTQKKGEMFWMDEIVYIDGITNATSITICPEFEEGVVPFKQSGVHRFYLDDIAVVDAADAVPSKIEISDLEDGFLSFEGTPGENEVGTFKVVADLPFYVSTPKWISVDKTEGPANDLTEIKVTCAVNDSPNLRKGYVTIKAGASTALVPVVQSSAGQEIAPFISIVGGNNVSVLGEGGEITVKVQSNTTYKVEAVEPWLTVAPATRALVEVAEIKATASPNATGATRLGHLRVYNESLGIEAIVNVEQENFAARIDVTPAIYMPAISGLGSAVTYHIDCSIPFTVTSNVDWITFPVASVPARGTYDAPVIFAANTLSEKRTATITFSNTDYDYTKEVTVTQFPSGIVFEDDFSWFQPMIDAYNVGKADNKKVGSTVPSSGTTIGTNQTAPNVYTEGTIKDLWPAAVAAAGWVDMCPANKVVYLQDGYIKYGKTGASCHTSWMLPRFAASTPTDVVLSYDWAHMVQGSGAIDDGRMQFEITGDGTFENGTKLSDIYVHPQQTSEIYWQHNTVKIIGATSNTQIHMFCSRLRKDDGTFNYGTSGGARTFLDNVKIVPAN